MRHHNSPADFTDRGNQIELDATLASTRNEQRKVEDLIERGFLWEEAIQLIQMQEHLYDNLEVQQRMAEDDYLLFARWLYIQGAMDEGFLS